MRFPLHAGGRPGSAFANIASVAMVIIIFGLSVSSSWGNGHATLRRAAESERLWQWTCGGGQSPVRPRS